MIYSIVERTPYRLRFLLVSEVGSVSPACGVIVNSDTLNIQGDLRFDTRAYLGYPMANLVRTPCVNQAAARKLFLGDGYLTVPAQEIPRAHCKLTPRTTETGVCPWAVDANEGAAAGVPASAGFGVLIVCGPDDTGQECYLDFYYEHTFDR